VTALRDVVYYPFWEFVAKGSAMAFQPANTLRSRTYLALIIAQFLAAFNDQCIHASAMFYAIHREFMRERGAIALMPILFFAPWAIFCTLAGYLADRYSKRQSLVFWKIAEVGIAVVALTGFFLGTVWHMNTLGPILVLSTVFLMGTHSAFFVPAKYGVLPEILQPSQLSKGNGVLESTSFLAVILGTMTGGILSSDALFKGREQWIGVTLVGLAVIGAAASLLIEKMPPANPNRVFPRNLVKPLFANLRVLTHSRPLLLSVLGIAFFTFMVAFMRAAVYMHGETRNPPWSEWTISLVVATVALGVGLGSPLAGFLSGGKVELGLVPLGTVGMIAALLAAGALIFSTAGLITMLIFIGFFSGFYIVPLYTLLQHRAPKTSKGDLIATSNFINVIGAIAASVLFFALVTAARLVGVAPLVEQQDNVWTGVLAETPRLEKGRPVEVLIELEDQTIKPVRSRKAPPHDEDDDPFMLDALELQNEWLLELVGAGMAEGDPVIVSSFRLHGATYYMVRPADRPLRPVYDEEDLPRFLFVGAACMTMGILVVLCRQLPDFFVRSFLWLRSWGRYRLRVVDANNMPSNGPVILATNCTRIESCLQVLTVTDRFTRFVLLDDNGEHRPSSLMRLIVRNTSLALLHPSQTPPEQWDEALDRAVKILDEDEVVGLPATGYGQVPEVDDFLQRLEKRHRAVIVPVYYAGPDPRDREVQRVKVVIGPPLPPETSARLVRCEIERLAQNGDKDGASSTATVRIPAASGASPTPPEADRPAPP
jgi:MFS family permease